eukprot:351204-Chlamydomonas_euryale.AAC.12
MPHPCMPTAPWAGQAQPPSRPPCGAAALARWTARQAGAQPSARPAWRACVCMRAHACTHAHVLEFRKAGVDDAACAYMVHALM